MMPCSRAAAVGGASAFAQAMPSPADENMTQADGEDADPTFLVVVLSGFSVSSQMPDTRTPRPTRLSNLGHSGTFSCCWVNVAAARVPHSAAGKGGNTLTAGRHTSVWGKTVLMPTGIYGHIGESIARRARAISRVCLSSHLDDVR